MAGPPPDAAALRHAAVSLAAKLDPVVTRLAQDDPLRAIAGDVDRLQTADDATLLAAQDALLRFLPTQLARLRTALAATPVTIAQVPADLRRAWLLPDGRARLQVLPRASSVTDSRGIRHFVDSVEPVLPKATGSAVWIVRSAQTSSTPSASPRSARWPPSPSSWSSPCAGRWTWRWCWRR